MAGHGEWIAYARCQTMLHPYEATTCTLTVYSFNTPDLVELQQQTSGKLLELNRTGGPETLWKIQILLVLQKIYRT